MRAFKFISLFPRFNISSIRLIVTISIFWAIFANYSFYSALLDDYSINTKNAPFLASVAFSFISVTIIILSLICFRKSIKPILIVLLLSSAMAAYFMDSYNVVIDGSMIRNMMETDTAEAGDLISLHMFAYLILLGIIPSILIYRANIIFKNFRQELASRAKLIGSLTLIVLILLFSQSAATASFFREHKKVRYYTNPTQYMYSAGNYIGDIFRSVEDKKLKIIGEDAKIINRNARRKLVIVVVGEAARADRFSLNGYKRETNPLLKKQDVISFSNVESCGTSTAISVPCMFSIDQAKGFNVEKAKEKENLLDVLKHAGVDVIWRDNNSSSKNVADRVTYQSYRSPDVNTICDEECRDIGMLVGLQDMINARQKGNMVVVLHQMGNHGPAYYKRYPKEFEKFQPVCRSNELEECKVEDISNAYDNAILYTDYFLNEVIELLKRNDGKFDVSMVYVSDHGESLGENNLYLHGLPNYLAPKTQRHVPMIIWIGKHFEGLDIDAIKSNRNNALSHDNLFHTLLGLMQVQTKVYDKKLDFTKR